LAYAWTNKYLQTFISREVYTSYDAFNFTMSSSEYNQPPLIVQRAYGAASGDWRDVPILVLHGSSSVAGEGAFYYAARSSGLTTRGSVSDTNILGGIIGVGYNDNLATYKWVRMASIEFLVEGTISASSSPGAIIFKTNPSGSNYSLTERIRIDNAGKLISAQMYSGYTVGGTNKAMYVDSTGVIGVLSSSLRTKQDVVDMEDVSWIDRLRPVNFAYRSTPGVKQYGLIAEEVEAVNRALVGYDAGGLPDSVTYDRLVPVLLQAVRELRGELRRLRADLLP
jgi:hypothetical protein